MTTPTFKESLDQLMMIFTQQSGQRAVNVYMNKSHLLELNTDLKADPERDLKAYRGSNIILWQHKNIVLGLLQRG